MTNTKKRHFTNLLSNDNLRIPTREEFHRYASNLLSEGDFCTEYSSEYQVDRVAKALDWSKKHTFKVNKGRNNGNN